MRPNITGNLCIFPQLAKGFYTLINVFFTRRAPVLTDGARDGDNSITICRRRARLIAITDRRCKGGILHPPAASAETTAQSLQTGCWSAETSRENGEGDACGGEMWGRIYIYMLTHICQTWPLHNAPLPRAMTEETAPPYRNHKTSAPGRNQTWASA